MPRSTSPARRTGRAAVAAAVAAAAGVLALVPGGGASAVVTDQWYPVPASGTYSVHGHGFGHGRGMSQYGALAAAQQGLSHKQILDFYYPGTSLEQTGGKIWVYLSADTGSELVVGARKGLRLKDLGNDKAYDLPTGQGATRWRLSVTSGNRDAVSWYDGSWHSWKPGGNDVLAGQGQFSAHGRPVTLHLPSGATPRYRGALRNAKPLSPGSDFSDRNTVNVLALGAYLRGVVPREVPATWSPQAVQAQAVAARTYAVHARADRRGSYSYDLGDTTSWQVYGGVDAEHPDSDAAVKATAGEILTYGGEPAFTEFSSSSGGWTVSGGRDYLVAKPDPYDKPSVNPYHDWTQKVSAGAIHDHWPSIGRLKGIRVVSRDGNGEWKGRVLTMRLVGSQGTKEISGDTFRSAFGLKSTWFSPS